MKKIFPLIFCVFFAGCDQNSAPQKLEKSGFEIFFTKNEIRISKFNGEKIDKIITKNPVRGVQFDENFLIFEEKNGENWESKTFNLQEFSNFLERMKKLEKI